MSAAAPVPAEEVALVAGLTHEGEGVVRGGKTVFVPGALPGERIRLRRTRRHRQHDDGVLLEVLTPSAQRVVPRCAHFGICGGCVLQHLAPAAQLAAKESELKKWKLLDGGARIHFGELREDLWVSALLKS